MLHKPLIVIKLGTFAITDAKGFLQTHILEEIVQQIIELHKNFRIVLVSSGAVGCGKSYIPHYAKKTSQQKAAAAIGNPLLMHHYQMLFSAHSNIPVAQTLCEKHHFANRESFLQLSETFQMLWSAGAIPIANENDVVCDYEIRFSDNDELASMIACGFSAAQLLLGSTVEGLLDKNGNVVSEIDDFSEEVLSHITNEKSDLGRGGMHSKLQCAQKAAEMGCEVILFDAKKDGNLLRAHKHETGTVCKPKCCNLNAHRRWISMGGNISGKVIVDEGAAKAVKMRKSLLLVGVKETIGEFKKGDLLEVFCEGHETPLAIGRAHIGQEDIKLLPSKEGQELIHTDELVLN